MKSTVFNPINYSLLRPFDIGFVTSKEFISRMIRLFESKFDLKSFFKMEIPSHVFFVHKIGNNFFAAEMIKSGLQIDESLHKYIYDSRQKIIGFKRLSIFADPSNVIKADEFVAHLKVRMTRYGFEDIARQTGLKIKDKPETLICSEFVECVCRQFGYSMGCGMEPNPYQLWTSPVGTKIEWR